MAEDELEVTPEQTEKIIQFQDLTGIDDMTECRQILERHQWNIEVAVQDTFNVREGAPSVLDDEPPPQRLERTPVVNASPSDQRIYTVSRTQRPHGILGWGYFIIFFPVRFMYSTILDIVRFAFRLLRPDPRRHVTDPLGDVMSFIQMFDQKYGPIHPTFYHGTYSQALTDAKRELKFLLVYLHGDDHQDTPNFCRDTLCDQEVAAFINTNMLFWACNTNSPEGYRVSQALRENTYPFLALIVLRNNKMTVVARIEGPINALDLITRLGRIMEENEGSLIAARADRDERSFNQSLRQEQDFAYQESLRQDQEKERRRREEIERKEMEINMEKQREMEMRIRQEELRLRKVTLFKSLPPEPDENENESVRIILKLPNGERIGRRFLKTQSSKYLYYYVFCHDDAPDDFQIVTNFPRKVLPCQPDQTDNDQEPPTFAELGLKQNEMLYVHDNEA